MLTNVCYRLTPAKKRNNRFKFVSNLRFVTSANKLKFNSRRRSFRPGTRLQDFDSNELQTWNWVTFCDPATQ